MENRQLSCAFIQQRLSAYLDNELSPSLTAEVDKHLAGCSRCRKEYAEQKRIWTSLAALSAPEPEARLETAVFRQISESEKRPLMRRLFPLPMGAGAAACGLFVGIFLASSAVKAPDTLIAPDDGIMQAMDTFSPSPKGSFSNAYFAMINGTSW